MGISSKGCDEMGWCIKMNAYSKDPGLNILARTPEDDTRSTDKSNGPH